MGDQSIEHLRDTLRKVEQVIANSLNGAAVMVEECGAEFDYEISRFEVTGLDSGCRRFRYSVSASAKV